MQILRNWWISIKEKPIVYIVFLLSIVVCVVVSSSFYRLTVRQAKDIDRNSYTYFNINEEFDNVKFYKSIQNNYNITKIEQRYSKVYQKPIEDKIITANIFLNICYKENENLFSVAEIESEERLAIVSLDYADEFDIGIGSLIDYGNVSYKVIRKANISGTVMYLTGSVEIDIEEGYMISTPNIVIASKKPLNDIEINNFCNTGLSYNNRKNFDTSAIIGIIMGLIVLAVASLNCLIAFLYIIKRNRMLYSACKIVGAENSFVAFSLSFEVFMSYILAFVIGIAIESPIAQPLTVEYFMKLNILDYITIFFINFAAIAIALTGIIIKYSKKKLSRIDCH